MAGSQLNPRVRTLDTVFQLTDVELRSVVSAMDAKFRRIMAKLYTSQGASGGEKWQDWSEQYAKFRRRLHGQVQAIQAKEKAAGMRRSRKGPPAPVLKILHLTGDLRRSLTVAGDPDHIATAERTEPGHVVVTLGTSNPVAAYHAPGDDHNAKLPVRDPIQLTDEQVKELIGVAEERLIGFVERNLRGLARLRR